MRFGRLGLVGVAALLAACGSDSFGVGGTVAGLKGRGLTLQNKGGDTLSVEADGPFSFSTQLEEGSGYDVTVASQPTEPQQTCSVERGAGKLQGAVSDVKVSCVTQTYAVGGTVSGLTSGTVTLQLNNGPEVMFGNGPFTFSERVEDQATFSAALKRNSPEQLCTLAVPQVRVLGADVSSLRVECAPVKYALGGTVEGLTGGTLELRLDSGETLPVTAAGPFTFQTRLQKGGAYAVSVATQPQGQRCAVSQGSGTVAGAVSDITVRCSPYFDLASFQAAAAVLGQAGFTTNATPATPGQGTLNRPLGNPTLAGGKLYVSDSDSHRVLGFPGVPSQNGATASFVLGQSGFTMGTSGAGQTRLSGPQGSSSDGTRLAVVDRFNNRILLHDTLPAATGAQPAAVLGQSDFASSGPACDSDSLTTPSDVFIGRGKVIVADTGNHRVLVWNSLPTSSGAPADLVLGQRSFTTCTSNDADGNRVPDASPSASTLSFPTAVWTDGTRLVVADGSNNRVLIWNQFPTTNGQGADVVLGQSGFATDAGATSAHRMSAPANIAATAQQLFVADEENNRVLVWNQFPTAHGTPADVVLGQPDFVTNDPFEDSTAAQNLSLPRGLLLAWPHVLVTDSGNNRVLVFRSR